MEKRKPLKTDSVILTSDDASKCKKTAVSKGYWKDDFISSMVLCPVERKTPEINRGYYARTEAIWNLLKEFVSVNTNNCQILSLGAGLDTNFWRLSHSGLKCTKYIEVDFPQLVNKKIYLIKRSEKLKSLLENVETDDLNTLLSSKDYHLLGCDLEDIDKLHDLFKKCLYFINVFYTK